METTTASAMRRLVLLLVTLGIFQAGSSAPAQAVPAASGGQTIPFFENPYLEPAMGPALGNPPAAPPAVNPPGPLPDRPPMALPEEPVPSPTGEPTALPLPPPSSAPPVPAKTPPEDAKPVKLWEGSMELGVNGTDGNSETFNLRGGAKVKRKSPVNILSADLDYRKDQTRSLETANRAFLDWRYEHLFGSSPWTVFVHGTVEYDEFQAFDLRVALDTGVGYRFIKNDLTTLTGRLGGGTSREIGGPNDRWVPEAVFGLDFEQKIFQRHKLCFSAEYRPDVTAFNDYRIVAKAGWEILLDEALHLSMKIGANDRYDSTPEGRRPNDIDYSVVLLLSF